MPELFFKFVRYFIGEGFKLVLEMNDGSCRPYGNLCIDKDLKSFYSYATQQTATIPITV